MDKKMVAAFVTEGGSATSHTAVLARSLGIPAVCGISVNSSIDGRRVAVDGYTGTVYVGPDDGFIEKLKKKYEKKEEKSFKAIDGTQKVKIMADISAPEEIKSAMISKCDGVGIFRSESLFKCGKTLPLETFQFDAYRKILEGMKGKTVSVQTLDIDGDKKGNFLGIFGEKNPSMGMRSIRICLKRPQIFKIQLRAILKASVCGNIQILLPMVTSPEEVRVTKTIFDEVKQELAQKSISFSQNIPVGVIIETPASAIISDELAKEADFFLIDADNLASYTLVMDMRHKSVLKMIEQTVYNAHKNSIRAGLCGAIASDTEILPELLKMGIDELSVNPKKVMSVKKYVGERK